jgi:hypothetical protein
MKKYPSTKELREVFNYVDGYFYWKIKPSAAINISDQAGTNKGSNGYCRIKFKKKIYLIHRLVWVWHGNRLEKNMEIDHINRDRADNRIENLRQVTRAVNLENQIGDLVCYCLSVKSKNKWKAYTKKNAVQPQKHLGYYRTKEEALKAVKEFYGGRSSIK